MIEIIPAIDIMEGKCVRLTKGIFSSPKVYSDDPVKMAKYFMDLGFRRLHLVDLEGARKGCPKNLGVLDKIASETNLHIDYGGGMLKSGDVESAFNAGAAMINLGSIAVKDPGSTLIIIHRFGKEKFILGADVKGERVVVSGWMEKSNFTLWAYLAKWTARGLNTVCCTDVSHDGTLMGPSVRLYSRLREKFPEITLIASGGVGSPEDVCKLDAIGMDAIIIGKAIYEGLIKPEELAGFIQKRHVI